MSPRSGEPGFGRKRQGKSHGFDLAQLCYVGNSEAQKAGFVPQTIVLEAGNGVPGPLYPDFAESVT